MTVEHHLKDHDLRVTDIRKRIYGYFVKTHAAVSHSELEQIFSNDFDRVTIYRTLNAFLEKGILHKIPTDTGAAKYALCKDNCTTEKHIDDHIHFKCLKCEKVVCLHELEIPSVDLPQNYKAKNAVLMYEGWCDKCN